jgi:hypothetical protein
MHRIFSGAIAPPPDDAGSAGGAAGGGHDPAGLAAFAVSNEQAHVMWTKHGADSQPVQIAICKQISEFLCTCQVGHGAVEALAAVARAGDAGPALRGLAAKSLRLLIERVPVKAAGPL